MGSTLPSRIPLWLDCDPGHDDAFAILLAAHHPSLHLLGISTVHGNASLARCTANATRVLQAIGRATVPVHPGTAKPFCRDAVAAPNIHGVSGLDGTSLLPPALVPPTTDPPCLLAMRAALLAQPPGTAWLVATGALTNVALLVAAFPEVVAHIAGLSIMGGAVGGGFTDALLGAEGRVGNVTPWAEFNVYCDPEAAAAVVSTPALAAKTTLIPLDVTHQVLGTAAVRHTLLHGTSRSPLPSAAASAPPSTLRRMLYELLMFFAHTYAEVFGLTAGPPLHDPLAVAVVLDVEGRERVGFREGRDGERWVVNVVRDGEMVGRTVVRRVEGEGVRIPRGVDVEAFWGVLEACVVRADGWGGGGEGS